MIHTIFTRQPEEDYGVFQDKLNQWIDNEYDRGWIIEILRFDFYYKDIDTNHYCDIKYRCKQDPEHLKVEERLKVGL